MTSKKLKISQIPNRIANATNKQSLPYLDLSERPISKKIERNGKIIKVKNKWITKKENFIDEIVYFDGYDFENMEQYSKNQFEEIEYRNSTYVIYKTSREIAAAVLKIYPKIKKYFEELAGYFLDCFGNTYLIAKKTAGKILDICPLLYEKRIEVVEKSLEILASLHMRNLLLVELNSKNIFHSEKEVIFSDMRSLRMSVKPETIIGSIINYLSSLVNKKIISKDDLSYLLAYYFGANYAILEQLAKLENKKMSDGQIIEKIEQQIISFQ